MQICSRNLARKIWGMQALVSPHEDFVTTEANDTVTHS